MRFSADDACMDVTQSHTISIATDFAAHDMYAQSSHLKKVEMTLRQQHSEAMASSNYKGILFVLIWPLLLFINYAWKVGIKVR